MGPGGLEQSQQRDLTTPDRARERKKGVNHQQTTETKAAYNNADKGN